MRVQIAVRAVALLAIALGLAVPPTAGARPGGTPVKETVLRLGETLEQALRRSRVDAAQAAGIIAALREEVALRRLQPGERVRVTWGQDGRIRQVTYQPAPTVQYEFRPEGSRWQLRKVSLPMVTRVVSVAGTLERSLFESLERLGETPALVARLVHLFEWDFDFAADALPGDRFRLLIEKRFVNDEFVGYGSILIAQYRSAGRATLTAVAFPTRDGKLHYFDAAGRSVRKMFLRAPLDFTRITSGYSQARRHPILGGVRPHLAVDYAAPPGTPVRAVADGIVEAAGWDGGNGLSITLRHARSYKTTYNHLSQVTVRRGQHVRQRQVIGRVGSTGLSTGPHLDYRVMRQGRLVDPLAERFVPGAPVPGSRLAAFRQHRDTLLKRLEREAPF
ncbi:MAG: M23 family metallopeptidase [Candidatus Rokubacteria bacterium]|nr:M23 family metallopeptidase [Candidatus Rokubacteria bacterium]